MAARPPVPTIAYRFRDSPIVISLLWNVRRLYRQILSGTLRDSSSSHVSAVESLGARQSPRGESDPPEPTFGPLGMAERLNWLIWKNRYRNTSSQRLISASEYSLRFCSGTRCGQAPPALSRHA